MVTVFKYLKGCYKDMRKMFSNAIKIRIRGNGFKMAVK